MIKTIWDSFKNQKRLYKAMLILFSLLFTKSIFISPFSLVSGIIGVLTGIFLWALVFVVCVAALYFLSKVSWQFKPAPVRKTKILLYMIPSVALSTILLLAFFPGIMSWDSMYIWECTISNDFSNLHPVTYVLFVDLLNNFVDSPWIVIAVQFTYAAFVFAYVCFVFEGLGLNKKICWATVLILSFYPVHAYANVSMLKDVTYIMSLVLMSVILLKILAYDRFSTLQAVAFSAAALVALFSRHNGLASIPLALFLLALYFFIKKKRAFTVKAGIVLAAVLIIFYSSNSIIITILGNRYWQRSTASDYLMMPSAQLSYTIFENWYDMTDGEKEKAETYLDTGYIKYQDDVIDNWQFNNRYLETLNMDEILQDKSGFIKFYFEMLKKYPLDMIKEYEQVTGIVWATPNYGYTLYRNYGIPKEYADIGIEKNYLLPKLGKYLDSLQPKIYFWHRPALYLMLSLLVLFIAKKRHGYKGFIIASPMLANAFAFLFGTPAQNIRYLYCNFTCFIILLLFTLMSTKQIDDKEAV